MDVRKEASALLTELGEIMKLGSLEFDENNQCSVVFDETIQCGIYLDEDMRALILFFSLGVLPDDETRESILYEFACGNYCWGRTEGGTLGVDPYSGIIALTYLVPLPLEHGVRFENIVAKLVANSAYWMRKLGQLVKGTSQSKNPEMAQFV